MKEYTPLPPASRNLVYSATVLNQATNEHWFLDFSGKTTNTNILNTCQSFSGLHTGSTPASQLGSALKSGASIGEGSLLGSPSPKLKVGNKCPTKARKVHPPSQTLTTLVPVCLFLRRLLKNTDLLWRNRCLTNSTEAVRKKLSVLPFKWRSL